VIDLIKETFPGRDDDLPFMAQKVTQTLRNGFRLLRASQTISFETMDPNTDINVIESIINNIPLTSEDEQLIDQVTAQVLSTPAVPRAIKRFGVTLSENAPQPQAQQGGSLGDRALAGDEAAIEELRRKGIF